MNKQPIQTSEIKNVSEYNSLNGFVAAITPFNFTAIGGNLGLNMHLFLVIVYLSLPIIQFFQITYSTKFAKAGLPEFLIFVR